MFNVGNIQCHANAIWDRTKKTKKTKKTKQNKTKQNKTNKQTNNQTNKKDRILKKYVDIKVLIKK